MSAAGKYGLAAMSEYDVNADGLVNLDDFAELANSWMNEGPVWADFDRSGQVEIIDLKELADQWLH